MTTAGTIILSLFSGLTVGGVVAEGLPESIPWKDIAGGGAAVLVVVVMLVFLRRDDTIRKEAIEARKEEREATKSLATDFSQTATAITAKFAETTTTLVRDAETRAEKREEALREMFDNMRNR